MNKDIEQLIEMLTYQRQAWTKPEEEFIHRFIDSIPGMKKDGIGNRYKRVGKSDVMFACHTDTVHYNSGDGRQNVYVDNGYAHTGRENILGGDDGVGVWYCIHMIKNRVPGLYVFHREEETGRIGSEWIVKNTPELLAPINKCVSLDRKGYDNIITKQRGMTCCSKEFAESLKAQLGGNFFLDPTGSFTDSASYMKVIPECTNLSIGYFNAHSPNEYVDLAFANWMKKRLINVNWNSLPVVRDPNPPQPAYNYQSYGFGRGYGDWGVQDRYHYSQNVIDKDATYKFVCDECGYKKKIKDEDLGKWLHEDLYMVHPNFPVCPKCKNQLRIAKFVKKTDKKKQKNKSKKEFYDYWGYNPGTDNEINDFYHW